MVGPAAEILYFGLMNAAEMQTGKESSSTAPSAEKHY